MKSYNGFTAAQRQKAFNWLRGEIIAGRRRVKPEQCQVCGQKSGPIAYHSEDYSQPYGDHIGAYQLCLRCHMMIHCRYRARGLWDWYKLKISEGIVFKPCFSWRQFQDFLSDTVGVHGSIDMTVTNITPRGKTFLDTLSVSRETIESG